MDIQHLNRSGTACAYLTGAGVGAVSAALLTSTKVLLGAYNGLVITALALAILSKMPESKFSVVASSLLGLAGAVPVTYMSAKVVGLCVIPGKVLGLSASFGLAALILAIVAYVAKTFFPTKFEAILSRFQTKPEPGAPPIALPVPPVGGAGTGAPPAGGAGTGAPPAGGAGTGALPVAAPAPAPAPAAVL